MGRPDCSSTPACSTLVHLHHKEGCKARSSSGSGSGWGARGLRDVRLHFAHHVGAHICGLQKEEPKGGIAALMACTVFLCTFV